ncbi:protocadherin Fat 4-like [Engraulis encrasicolus]|uniref:protocadherin Fat 4-like n=1 Tax=Engraulis encrasicolus TaxID=184585 RepID=UPI002FD56C97
MENPVNCDAGSALTSLGRVDEGYEGPVENLTGIPEGTILSLEPLQESTGNTFLMIGPIEGGSAVVSTTKELDADSLKALANGSSVLTVTAVDADATNANNVVSYSIQAPRPPEFSIDTNGVIKLLRKLNYNAATSYTFTVIARDPPGKTATAAVTVTVADYDDLNPYFDHNVYTGSIMENEMGEMTSVLPEAIKAQDGDKGINQPVVYSITSVAPGEFTGNLAIDANTGVITVRSALDREQVSSINIHIKAEQNNDPGKTANALVVVNVEDYNDNPPEFDKTAYNASISENSPNGYFILQTKVTDKDLGGFIGTLRLIPDTVPFTISNDGIITVKTSADLDRETNPSFTFQVEAREDDHTETADVVITLLDVNDNSPQFSSSKYEGKVFSNQTVGMNVVKVEATDADEGVNGEVTYSIDAGNEDDHFTLDENSGDITLAKVIILEDNTVKRFSLYVTARDGGEISRASSVLVAIQAPGNSDPQFTAKIYHATVEEEIDPPVKFLKVDFYSVSSVVPVTLQVNTYQDLFSIDNNGELSTKAKLDYEVQSNYTVSISLSDGTKSDTAEVKVQVLDVNDNSPVFVGNPFTFTLSEDVKLGTNMTVLTATDADSGFNGEVRYSIQGGGGSFEVDPKTGRITVDKALDREEADEITFKVVATDQGRPSRSATADVTVTLTDVNDNNPVFAMAQHYIAVSEIDEPGLVLVKLNATDADDGVNAAVTYLITKQDPVTKPPAFGVDAVSGELTLAAKLDFGNATRYVLTVEAVDGGTPPLTGVATVMVQVEDVNNNLVFSRPTYNFSVLEHLLSGSEVGVVLASSDSLLLSVSYALKTHQDAFSIDSSGLILTRVELDTETEALYVVSVEATDTSKPPNTALAVVTVQVKNVNEAPVFDNKTYKAEIFSNAPFKTPVVQVKATDPDVGDMLQYSLVEPSSMFDIEPSSGQVYVVSLEGESGKETLEVKAEDKHGLHATATVEVTVNEVADTNVVVISLNQPINAVEKKAPELEQSMGRVLGWTVRIVSISTSNGGASDRSAPIGRESRTYISFVAMDTSGTAIAAEKVKSKLTEEEQQVQSELEKVFGSGLEHEVERGPGESVSDPMQTAVIALSVLLALSIVGIIVLTVVSVKKFRNMKREKDDSELDSFGLNSRHNSVSSGKVNPANSAQSSPQSQRRASEVSKQEDNTSEDESDTDRL